MADPNDPGNTFDDRSAERIARVVQQHEATFRRGGNAPPPPIGRATSQRWFAAINKSGSTIPAYACVRIDDHEIADTGEIVFHAVKPDGDAEAIYALAGGTPAPDGATMAITFEPSRALFDASPEPSFGDELGPQDDSWSLHDGEKGFQVLAITDESHVAFVQRVQPSGDDFITFRNDDSTEMPQYGLGQVTEVEYDDDREVYVVKRPKAPIHDTDYVPVMFVWNASGDVPAGEEGKGLVINHVRHKVLTLKYEGDDPDVNWMLSPRPNHWAVSSMGKAYFRVIGDIDTSAKSVRAEVLGNIEHYVSAGTNVTLSAGQIYPLGANGSAAQVDGTPLVGALGGGAAISHRGNAVFVSRDDANAGGFVQNFVGELGKLRPVHTESFGASTSNTSGSQYGLDPRLNGERKAMIYMPGFVALSGVADGKVWLMEDQISIGIAVAKGTFLSHSGSAITGYHSVRCWAGPGTTSAYPVTSPYYNGDDSNRPDIEITVYIPRRQGVEPAIFEGDLVHYAWMPLNGGNRYPLCLTPAYDDPRGTIKMWHSATNIPPGWQLCDGTNGTVDLRQKFIRGRDPSEGSPPTGAATHNHTAHSTATLNYQAGATAQTIVTTATHSDASHIPPYVTISFIQRVS